MINISNSSPIWLFDVDGTLTPAGGAIDPTFEAWLYRFASENDVRIVSGGDHERIIRQLGARLTSALTRAYCCLGSSVWQQGVEVSRTSYVPSSEMLSSAESLARQCRYPGPINGDVLREKPGGFSVVPPGLGASPQTLKTFELWDEEAGERARIADILSARYPELCVQVSGRSSIDCFREGLDKSQIVEDLKGPVTFLADSMHPSGNDFGLAQVLRKRGGADQAIPVCSWRQTWAWLLQAAPLVSFPWSYSDASSVEACLAYY